MKKRLMLVVIILIVFIIGCSSEIKDEATEEEIKESLYDQALKDLGEDNSTKINTNLDKRYDYLKDLVEKILAGEQELKMGTFTRIKIELDYLNMVDYDKSKMNLLQNSFMQAFTKAGQIEEEDYSGYSLNDRYYSLESKIERISSGETELGVANYLQMEKELNYLGEEEFLANKVNTLRTNLLKTVISELESGMTDFEIPEEVEEEPVVEEVSLDESKEEDSEEEEVEEAIVFEEGNVVNLINGGFDKEMINVKINETVEFKNIRSGRFEIALIIGNRECRHVKSKIFRTGESFNATFTEPMTCWISDGIFTTQAMRVVVS